MLAPCRRPAIKRLVPITPIPIVDRPAHRSADHPSIEVKRAQAGCAGGCTWSRIRARGSGLAGTHRRERPCQRMALSRRHVPTIPARMNTRYAVLFVFFIRCSRPCQCCCLRRRRSRRRSQSHKIQNATGHGGKRTALIRAHCSQCDAAGNTQRHRGNGQLPGG